MKMLRKFAFRMVVPRSVAKYGSGMSKQARKCVITEAWIYGLALAGYQIYTFVLQQRLNEAEGHSRHWHRQYERLRKKTALMRHSVDNQTFEDFFE